MPAQLRIRERLAGDVVILDLAGRLEIGDGDIELAASFDSLVSRGYVKIILNLQDVSHIDSRGIAVMVSKQISLRKRDGDVRLLNVGERTHRTLVVTRLLEVFETFTSEEAAVASFAQPARRQDQIRPT